MSFTIRTVERKQELLSERGQLHLTERHAGHKHLGSSTWCAGVKWQDRCVHTWTPLWLKRACSTADEHELQVIPLTRSNGGVRVCLQPLCPPPCASKPAPSTMPHQLLLHMPTLTCLQWQFS